jgi:hypothetical protein
MCAHTDGLLRRLRLGRPLSIDCIAARHPRQGLLARTPREHTRRSQRARQSAPPLARAALRNVSELREDTGGGDRHRHRRRAGAHRRLHHPRALFRSHIRPRAMRGCVGRGQSAPLLYRSRRTGRLCAVRGSTEIEGRWMPSRVGKRTRRGMSIGREEGSSDVIPRRANIVISHRHRELCPRP